MPKCLHDDVDIAEEVIAHIVHGFSDGKWYGESGTEAGDLTGHYVVRCHRCKYERVVTRKLAPKWAQQMIDQIWERKAVEDLPRRY